MKKFIYSFVLVISFVIYGVFQNRLKTGLFDDDNKPVIPPANLQQTTTDSNATPVSDSPPSNTNSNTNTTATTPVKTPTPVPAATGQYKNGSYTGSVADALYGNIQVKAVITGGKLTDVLFLQYPNDRSHSVEINTQAMPWLKQEAIQAQNSNVDIISGATDSSRAFRESLASALNQARN